MTLDWIIGVPNTPAGWMMLMASSPPAARSRCDLVGGGAKALTRFTGAYARVRSQFRRRSASSRAWKKRSAASRRIAT